MGETRWYRGRVIHIRRPADPGGDQDHCQHNPAPGVGGQPVPSAGKCPQPAGSLGGEDRSGEAGKVEVDGGELDDFDRQDHRPHICTEEDQPDGLYSLSIVDQRLTPIANNGELPFLLSSFTLDKQNNQLLYIVAVFELFQVLDLTTLQTRTLTSRGVGTGESLRPNGVVLDASGKFVYTFSFNPQDRGAVYAVELRSGDRVLISR